MIKFFRKIRRQFLIENKFRKYLIYALGETFLVVTGILIAVQVNNWNERNKLVNQEEEILLLLEEELRDNLNLFDLANARNRKTLKRVEDYMNDPILFSKPDSSRYLTSLFNYSPLEINQTILDKILDGTDEKILIGKGLLKKIRRLKRRFVSTEKTLFYLDEFWNTNTASLLISSNLGDYMTQKKRKFKSEYIPDERFRTTLIMQEAFLFDYVSKIDVGMGEIQTVISEIQKLSIDD